MLKKVRVFPLAILEKFDWRRKQHRKGHLYVELLEMVDLITCCQELIWSEYILIKRIDAGYP